MSDRPDAAPEPSERGMRALERLEAAGLTVLPTEQFAALVAARDAAERERDALAEALAWFADDANYDSDGPDHDSSAQAYGAERAQNALAGLNPDGLSDTGEEAK